MKPFTGKGILRIFLDQHLTVFSYHIGDSEECFNQSSDEKNNVHYQLWDRVNDYFRRRGFRVGSDPDVVKNYKCLSKDRKYGIKNGLEFKASRYPTGFEYKFFQNIVFENPYEGEHDYNQYDKMPYMIKLAYRNEMLRLAKYAESIGVIVKIEHKLTDTEEIIKSNNNNLHVHGRIESLDDLKAIMKQSDMGHNSTDQNRKQIICGDFKCFYDYNKKIAIGRAYHNINSMWWMLVNGRRYNICASDLFDQYPGMPKKKPLTKPQQIERFNQELKKAEASMNYERCIVLRNLIKSWNTGKLYHVISIDDGLYWRGNNSGYTRDKSQAGIYIEEEILKHPDYYNNGVNTKAVEVAIGQ
jgi:hypothetical protein